MAVGLVYAATPETVSAPASAEDACGAVSLAKWLMMQAPLLILGVVIGIALAVLWSSFVHGRRTPRQGEPAPAAEAAPFPVLGTLPRLREGPSSGLAARLPPWLARFGRSRIADESHAARALHAFKEAPHSEFSREIRALRDALIVDSDKARQTVVLITSKDAGVGKTTIAVNLAHAATAAGERTLVIDANCAHPTLADLLAEDLEPRLILLAGATRLLYEIGEGLFVVPIREDEEMIAHRLRRHTATPAVEGIKSNFDFVVIDGPTIGDDDTARIVAEAVDQVVLVLPRAASGQVVEDALEQLRLPRRKFRGAVFTPPM